MAKKKKRSTVIAGLQETANEPQVQRGSDIEREKQHSSREEILANLRNVAAGGKSSGNKINEAYAEYRQKKEQARADRYQSLVRDTQSLFDGNGRLNSGVTTQQLGQLSQRTREVYGERTEANAKFLKDLDSYLQRLAAGQLAAGMSSKLLPQEQRDALRDQIAGQAPWDRTAARRRSGTGTTTTGSPTGDAGGGAGGVPLLSQYKRAESGAEAQILQNTARIAELERRAQAWGAMQGGTGDREAQAEILRLEDQNRQLEAQKKAYRRAGETERLRQEMPERPEAYTPENAAQYLARGKYLASKDAWTEEDRAEARELQAALVQPVWADSAVKHAEAGDILDIQQVAEDLQTRLNATGDARLLGLPGETGEALDRFISQDLGEMTALGQGLIRGTGAQSLARGIFAGNEDTQAQIDRGDRQYEFLMQNGGTSVQASGFVGNTLGSVAGMTAAAGAAGGVLGAVPGFTALSPGLQAAAKTAAAFMTQDAVSNLGAEMTGEMTMDEYMGGIVRSGLAGMVGQTASGLVNSGIAQLLSKHDLMTPFMEFVRQMAGSTAFTAAKTGTELALTERQDLPSGEQLAQQMAAAFLFSAVNSAIGTIETTRESRARMEASVAQMQQDFEKISTGAKSAEDIRETGDRILRYSRDIRQTISQNYYPGQQAYIDQVRSMLDTLDERVGALMQGTVPAPQPGITDGAAPAGYSGIPGAPDGLVPSGGGQAAQTEGPGAQEIAQQLQQAVQQGVRDQANRQEAEALYQQYGETAGAAAAQQNEDLAAELQREYGPVYRQNRQAEKTDGKTDYRLQREADGSVSVIIDANVLEGKPQQEWKKAVQGMIRKIFRDGVDLPRGTVYVNKKGVGEFTNGSYTRMLEREDPQTYQDKMRMSAGLEGIVQNSGPVHREAAKHDRSDDIVAFNRGDVRVTVRDNAYRGDVLTAIYSDGKETFFDINNLQRKTEKEATPHRETAVRSGSRQVGDASEEGAAPERYVTAHSDFSQTGASPNSKVAQRRTFVKPSGGTPVAGTDVVRVEQAGDGGLTLLRADGRTAALSDVKTAGTALEVLRAAEELPEYRDPLTLNGMLRAYEGYLGGGQSTPARAEDFLDSYAIALTAGAEGESRSVLAGIAEDGRLRSAMETGYRRGAELSKGKRLAQHLGSAGAAALEEHGYRYPEEFGAFYQAGQEGLSFPEAKRMAGVSGLGEVRKAVFTAAWEAGRKDGNDYEETSGYDLGFEDGSRYAVSDDGGQRAAGVGARGQAGAVEEGAGGSESREGGRLRNRGAGHEGDRTDLKKLGVASGTDAAQRVVRRERHDYGGEVITVSDRLEVYGADGKKTTVQAISTGKDVILREGDPMYGQHRLHELEHVRQRSMTDEEITAAFKEKTKDLPDGKVRSILRAYALDYYGLYGEDSTTMGDLYREYLADRAAGIAQKETDKAVRLPDERNAARDQRDGIRAMRASQSTRYGEYEKPITPRDVETLRTIGRKSVSKFTSEDIEKAQKWAYKLYQDIGTKSPFFRAWFGDWRANQTGEAVAVAEIPAYVATNEARRRQRGIVANADTGWEIRISREGQENTISHAGGNRLSEYGLSGIQNLVRDAVLLDTEVHEHHSNNARNDLIAFDHKLYSLGRDTDGNVALYKITVEESYHDAKNTNERRFHNLKYVEKVATVGGRTAGQSLPGVSTNDDIATSYSVADLYGFVKGLDKDFTASGSVNPYLLNEDGTPKVFYHGTRESFTEFKLQGKAKFGRALGDGFYFTPSYDKAFKFANGLFSKGQDRGGIIMQEFLKMEHPYVIERDADRTKWKNAYNQGNYDGIIDLKNETYYVEDPGQIKSATDSIGTFDREMKDIRYSVSAPDRDSAGRELSAEQAEYFKDSKVRDKDGNLLVMYHQTDGAFTVFDTKHDGAGARDNETPFGIFLKTTDRDIGVRGKNQMALYANITNPLHAENRADLVRQLRRLSPEYDRLKTESGKLDAEYGKKHEAAKKAFVDFLVQWRRDNPTASRSAIYDDPEFNAVYDAEDNVVTEWQERQTALDTQAKEAITEALRKNGYDGVILARDAGSFGRSTDAYIALDANQVKNPDNLAPTENPDIRYSVSEEVEPTSSAEYAQMQRGRAPAGPSEREAAEQRKRQVTLLSHMTERAFELRRQFTEGTQRDLRTTDIPDVASDLLRFAGRKAMGRGELEQRLSDIAMKAARSQNPMEAYQIAKEEADYLAADMMRNATGQTDEAKDMWDGIRQTLRSGGKPVKLAITGQSRADLEREGGYEHLRKRLMGYAFLSAGGTPVDVFYEQELTPRFPTAFPDTIQNPADQLIRIVEVLDRFRQIFKSPWAGDAAEDTELLSQEIMQRLYNANVQAPSAEAYAAQREEMLQAHYEQRIAETRQRMQTEMENLRRSFDEKRQGERTARQEQKDRDALLHLAQRLDRVKVGSQWKAKAAELVGNLDTIAKSMTGRTILGDRIGNLSADGIETVGEDDLGRKYVDLETLRDWVREMQAQNPDFMPDRRTMEKIGRLDKVQIADMDIGDVRALLNAMQNLENEMRTSRKLIDAQDKRDVAVQTAETVSDIESARGVRPVGVKKAWSDLIVTEGLSPVRFLHRVTGYNDEDPLYRAGQALQKGETKMHDYARRAEAMFRGFMEDKAFLGSLAGPKARTIEVTGLGANGTKETVKITPDMQIAIFLHSFNNDNVRHAERGGFVVPDYDLLRKGHVSEAYNQGTLLRLRRSQMRAVQGNMTEREIQFARAVYRYFNTMSKNEINEVSRKLLGYDIAGVKNYYPIETSRKFRGGQPDTVKGQDGSIEGMSFTKSRQGAVGPINLRGAVDTLTRSIDRHGKYVGLAIPVRNFGKLYGNTTWQITPTEEQGALPTQDIEPSSLQWVLDRQWGSGASAYIDKLMADIQNPSKKLGSWTRKLAKVRSNYAGSVLTMNASVAVKQAASYPTAAAVVGWDALAKASKYLVPGVKADIEFIAQHTPLLWYRSKGYSTQELGDMAKGQKQIPKGLNWIQAVDVKTTMALWKAAEYYVQKQQPKLEVRSDAYWDAVTEVYERIILETQPNYTTMERPQLLRSEDTLLQNLAMFKTQPFQNFNIAYDALANLQAKERQLKAAQDAARTDSSEETQARLREAEQNLKNAKKGAARGVSALVISAGVFSAMTLLWNIIRGNIKRYRDDDKNEINLKTIGEAFVSKTFLSDTVGSLAGMVPWGAELYELIRAKALKDRYYGIDALTPSAISDFLEQVVKLDDTVSDVVNAIKGDSHAMDSLLSINQIGTTASKLFGAPVENVENLMKAAAFWLMQPFMSKEESSYWYRYYTQKTTAQGRSSADKDDIYAAYRSGNQDGYRSMRDAMEKWVWQENEKYQSGEITREEAQEKAAERMDGAMRDRIKEDLLGGGIDRKTAEKLLRTIGGQDEEKARESVDAWLYRDKSGNQDASAAQAGAYYAFAEPAGLSTEVFAEAWDFKQNVEGDKDSSGKTVPGSAKQKVVDYIQGLGLGRDQEKALWDALKGNWKDTDTPWE